MTCDETVSEVMKEQLQYTFFGYIYNTRGSLEAALCL